MAAKSAKNTFKGHLKGPNFMTEIPISYGWFGHDLVYELSEGFFMGDHLVGVTVVDAETGDLVKLDEFKEVFINEEAMSRATAAIAAVKERY